MPRVLRTVTELARARRRNARSGPAGGRYLPAAETLPAGPAAVRATTRTRFGSVARGTPTRRGPAHCVRDAASTRRFRIGGGVSATGSGKPSRSRRVAEQPPRFIEQRTAHRRRTTDAKQQTSWAKISRRIAAVLRQLFLCDSLFQAAWATELRVGRRANAAPGSARPPSPDTAPYPPTTTDHPRT